MDRSGKREGGRVHRWAVSGLLAVCLLLAGGLGLTAYLNFRAAHKAAQDVLYSRASELAASFISTARWSGAFAEDQQLGQLAGEMAADLSSITVLDRDGMVQAAGGRSPDAVPVGQRRTMPINLFLDLRAHGQYGAMVAGSHFEYWRPLPPALGRGWGRRPRRYLRPGATPDGGPGGPGHESGRPPVFPGQPTGEPGGAIDGPPPPPPPGADHGWGPPFRLLRVTIPIGAARSLTRPARLTVSLAGAVSLALLALGLLLHRAARRAQRAESELQRRRALSALGEMAAVLAHEIRTPLASIKGNAQLIGEGLPDDERAGAIVDEAARLERLVNGLLEYARPREPRRLQCNPDELIGKAAQIVAPIAAASSVDLVTDPCGCGPCLHADPDQILQVLVNLLQNAVEATAAGQTPQRGPVVIRARRAGGRVSLAVLDSGPGLPDDAPAEQLFRPFFSTKREGTGLGLAVARQLVEQHAGELELRPREEGGVMAAVNLPEGGQ